jgi:hypothetical protein
VPSLDFSRLEELEDMDEEDTLELDTTEPRAELAELTATCEEFELITELTVLVAELELTFEDSVVTLIV